MLDLFKMFGNESKTSKNVAKERLKLVLVHDRVDCSSKFLDMIKGDIINVISEYIEIDESGLDVRVAKTRSSDDDAPMSALVANIPIRKVKEGIR
ncbi:MAG: cell division topological specificity factor MinE [Tepidibacter sp.]|uniref:cell division topological specificity factor MinE n=1 Tax=Tepidibacter sp. TaxID=2529387 RepID=UPI0025F5754F|nr:cell division topological specificity factor MinE [Tepidibacter sp.]MCT4508331.1 cell division topological specificity factor MinE [Tepidibacter sp.]